MSDLTSVSDNMLRRATIGDQLRRHALRTPEKPALIFYTADGSREVISYKELNERSNHLARALQDMGVERGDVVAAMSRNNPDYVTAFYATLKLGAAFTGINFTFKKGETQYQLGHAEPKVLLVEEPFVDVAKAATEGLDAAPSMVWTGPSGATAPEGWRRWDELLHSSQSASEPEVGVDENDTALLVYTSGTEAFPKGVMIPHRNYLISTTPAWVGSLGINPDDVWLFLMPFHTIAGLGSMTTLTVVGATLVLVEALQPAEALKMISNERVTIVAQTPTFYLQVMQLPEFAEADLSCLTRCMTYGGLVPRAMIEGYQKVAPDLVWGTYWGQSELSQLGSVGWFSSLEDIPGQDPSWIGRPVPQLEIRVVDQEGNDVEEGELIARSPSVMRGYFKDPEKTAAVIRDGWLHTGDLVRTDGKGNLFFVDRRKDMIKTGGMNVSSVEVERTIYTYPGVLQVAVVGAPDEYWSEAVTAFVVPQPEVQVDPQGIINHCKESIAGFKVPKKVHVVDELPRDTQGKILKRELRKQLQSRDA
jgi:acyl-CoA synthetase (AMP-forming)/AMP-acid ligase II